MQKLENVERNVAIQYSHGVFVFKLGNLLLDHDVSINALIRETGLDFGVVRRLLRGEIIRPDLNVMEKICCKFNCQIQDIVEYVPDKKKD